MSISSGLLFGEDIAQLGREISSAQNTGAAGTRDQDLLRLLNEWVTSVLAPLILDANEGYWLRTLRVPVVRGQQSYRIPTRAQLGKLNSLRFVNSTGKTADPLIWTEESEVDSLTADVTSEGEPRFFWLRGLRAHVFPLPIDGFIEFIFPMRPSQLLLSQDSRKVASISGDGLSITVESLVPTNDTRWVTNSFFDCHSGDSGSELRFWDRQAVSVIGQTITFSSPVNGTLSGEEAVEVGDWLCPAGFSALPQLPYEFHPLLGQAIAVRLTETLDLESHVVHQQQLDVRLRQLLDSIKPRVDSEPRMIPGAPFLDSQGGSFY